MNKRNIKAGMIATIKGTDLRLKVRSVSDGYIVVETLQRNPVFIITEDEVDKWEFRYVGDSD